MRIVLPFVAFLALAFSGCDFTVETVKELPGNPVAIATGDFDGNGMPDAALGYGSDVSGISLVMQDDYGFWSKRLVSNLLFGGNDLVAATDANDDGATDVVVGGTGSGFVNLLRNHGDATFTTVPAVLPPGSQLDTLVTGSNPAGRQLVIARYRDAGDVTRFSTYEATGGGLQNLQSAWTPVTPIDPDAELRLADVSNSGHLDLVAGNDDGDVEVFTGSNADFGNFAAASGQTFNGTGAGAVTALAFGDAGSPAALRNWSVDGFTDLLVAYSSSPVVYGWRGQSDGSFAAPVAMGGQEFGAAPLSTANIEIRGSNGAWATNATQGNSGGAIGYIGDRFGAIGYFEALSCSGPAQSIIDSQGLFDGISLPGLVIACATGNQVQYIAYQRGRLKITAAPTGFGEQAVGSQSTAQAITVDATDSHFTDGSLESEVKVSEWRLEGDDAEDFSVSGSTGDCPYFEEPSLPPNIYHHNNCSAQVRFTPQSPGAKTARLVVVNDGVKAADAPYQSVELEGFATSKLLSVTESVDLGRVADVESASVSVKNDGNRAINLSSFVITPAVAGWSASAGSCGPTLEPEATCQAEISFGGGAPGESTASLVISGDQAAAPTTVALAAEKVSGAIIGEDLDFDDVPVGDSASVIATLTNDDEDSVTFDNLEIEGTDADRFAVVSEDCTDAPVTAAASCTVTVDVSPTERGSLSAQLRVSNDSTAGDTLVELNASGIQGVLAETATELSFGSAAAGSFTERTLTLTNEGDSELTIEALNVSAPFSIVDGCSDALLGIGESCQLSLKFAPSSPGQFSAALAIPNDGEGATRSVTLRGEAPAPRVVQPAPPNAPIARIGKPRVQAGSVRLARNGRSARIVVSVTAKGGSIKNSVVTMSLPRVLHWRPMSEARDSRNRARRAVRVRIGDIPSGATRAFAVRLFSSRDLRDWSASLRVRADSAQGPDSVRVKVGG